VPEPQSLFGPPSPTELQSRLEAERAGTPFLLYRDQDGAQVIIRLETQTFPFTIGRNAESRLCIEWDRKMSRVHAEIISLGAEYAILDDGLSRNGSFLNGKRIAGRTRLRDNDVMRLGQTAFLYRAPAPHEHDSTAIGTAIPISAQISPAQRRVLVALARPFGAAEGVVTPATNQQIASELFLSVEAVKTHLRALGVKLGVQDLPQNQKRATLVQRALAAGVITPRDLQNEARE
jgi:pSer/pThr/pTyr-binding forkhead associated (FHA) protein